MREINTSVVENSSGRLLTAKLKSIAPKTSRNTDKLITYFQPKMMIFEPLKNSDGIVFEISESKKNIFAKKINLHNAFCG